MLKRKLLYMNKYIIKYLRLLIYNRTIFSEARVIAMDIPKTSSTKMASL